MLDTIRGDKIPLKTALIPAQFPDQELNQLFYNYAAIFNEERFPDCKSFQDWQHIVMQDVDSWGANLVFSADMLAENIDLEILGKRYKTNDEVATWLNNLIVFFYTIQRQDLCESKAIYIGRDEQLSVRKELAYAESFNHDMVGIGDQLEQNISRQLLHEKIIHVHGVPIFNVKGCYDKLNKYIGDLEPSVDTDLRYPAVIRLNTMFTENPARTRDGWYLLIKQLLPDITPDRKTVTDMDDFIWAPAEKAAIRYVCWIIGKAETFAKFKETYFESNDVSALEWLNKFIEVLFRTVEYQEFLAKYRVILMQDGTFRQLTPEIHAEPVETPYPLFFKELYSTHSGLGDVKSRLISRDIKNENLHTEPLTSITNPVDKVFLEDEVEKHVEKGGKYNDLFHKLNTYKPNEREEFSKLFSTFSLKRLTLYAKAFGPEVSSMLMKMTELNKTIDDIEEIINLNMTVAELTLLKKVSEMVGGTSKLLVLAQQMADNAAEAAWRKKVGDAAEDAFKSAISGIDAFYLENPDSGFDFEILMPGTDRTYFLEIKSTVATKENVQMSSKQGKTARDNSEKYALCVLNRVKFDDEVNEDYFKEHARFLLTIGNLVSVHVNGMEDALVDIRNLYIDESGTALDSEGYSVFVGKKQWSRGINFEEFVNYLQTSYFGLI